MNEIKWRYFKITGKTNGKSKKLGIRALTKPSISEAKEICKDYLDEVLDEVSKVEEITEDLVCYYAI